MCGIVGIVASDIDGYKDHINCMVLSLSHRGPDGSGTYFFDGCALGHTRLSIIDLKTGQQPMISDNNTGITFNGEIYGYKEIRLSLKDYPFRTTSDTEVILALYHRYGNKLLSHLPGMFSFAIWDDKKKILTCARDRFGEKPFYYAFGKNGEFVFASEIKAILATGLVIPILDGQSLAHYLKYLYVHPYKTIYSNIFTLPPAHCLFYDFEKRALTIERYWNLPQTFPNIEILEAVDIFKDLLNKAVRRQLVADVPVGVFLSGGLDSSTIVSFATHHKQTIQTFSFGFENSISELPFARQVASKYKTDLVELTDNNTDIGQLLVTMQAVYDEPFADSSNIPTYLISKLAKQHCKVILSGDGGDELFGGYDSWYMPLFHMEKADIPRSLIYILRILLRIARIAGMKYHNKWNYCVKGDIYRRRHKTIIDAHLSQKEFFSDDELRNFGFRWSDLILYKKMYRGNNTVDDAFRMDIENYMPGDILVKIDRASMANGLELRAPFLDVDFASFCISLPSRLKITEKCNKLILRETCGDMWPEDIRYRNKQGFGAPVNKWLLLDTVRDLKEQYLNNPKQRIFSLVSFEKTREVVKLDNSKTWILLVLSLWMESHNFKTEAGV